jgi:hypothetical protein
MHIQFVLIACAVFLCPRRHATFPEQYARGEDDTVLRGTSAFQQRSAPGLHWVVADSLQIRDLVFVL